jgi:signal transduction histidine kinase
MTATQSEAAAATRAGGKARQLELEGAERRVVEHLKTTARRPSSARRVAVLAAAGVLFAATFAARLAIPDPGALLANFYVVPIALLAIEFGAPAGVLAAGLGFGLVFVWSAIETIHVTTLGYASRGAVLLITGVVVGWFSERLRHDIAERQRAQRHLSLYADELERANRHLSRSVEQLEAFAEIARAVGGETDLERVLLLILAHGKEIVPASRLLVYLPDGDELAAVSATALPGESQPRLPLKGSLAGEVLLSGRPRRVHDDDHSGRLEQMMPAATAAILVPLVFRGESVGVLAGVSTARERGFESEDEELLMSVAASAATAVATARSVAAARLRLSLEAADVARTRWARELHDETLQGLIGVRMVLSAGLASDEPALLRGAAQTADAHLGEELRSLRDLIAELRPAALDDLGLGPAIESLAKRQAAIGQFSVDVAVSLDGRERLGRDTENAIYRIVQEALNNAVKHAHAPCVSVCVDQLADQIELTVQDDGRGFDPSRVREGFGLTGMRERAVLAGGRLAVNSAHGGPTSVTAVLPLSSSGNGAGRHLGLG